MPRYFCVWVVGLLALAPRLSAELLPAETPLETVVDHYVEAGYTANNVAPAGMADDANFLRRVTLDLAGRIPTAAETEAYLADADPQKRQQLVDRLLSSPDFAYHLRNELDAMLMPGRQDGGFREYLLRAVQEQRPWPQLFSEMMLGREYVAEEKPALAFLKTRAANVDDLTNDTSKLFFGVSINCAKCHDHPLVSDWKQDHYFGMASFFNRTYLTKKNFLAERDDGGLKFRTTSGVEKEGRLMFLTEAAIEEPVLAALSPEEAKALEARLKEDDQRDTPPDPPRFSRRSQLVELALSPDPDGFFVRSFVNRTWHRVFGHGLVMPLDQMHSANEPSHPDLLRWLARDTLAHQFDVLRLTRGLVLSQAYARSSRWDSASDRPDPRHFAVAQVKPLSPMQYSVSLCLATRSAKTNEQQMQRPEEWVHHRRNLEGQAHGFASQLEAPGENFQVSVSEALAFSNGSHTQNDFLRDGGDRLIGELKGLADGGQMLRQAYVNVLSRLPDADELQVLTDYLASRADRPLEACQQLVWTLITNGEFRFNY